MLNETNNDQTNNSYYQMFNLTGPPANYNFSNFQTNNHSINSNEATSPSFLNFNQQDFGKLYRQPVSKYILNSHTNNNRKDLIYSSSSDSLSNNSEAENDPPIN